MVSNHVKDLIERYGFESEIPHELTDYVRARKFYDYDEHSRVGAKHGEFVTDEICDRFCVLGNPEQATAKLRELESIGVDQFNIYLMTHGQEETLAAYGRDIIPQFQRAARSAEDRLPERARDQLDRGRGGRVLAIEDRVHLDHLERSGEPGLRDELEREVRLAIGEPAADRRPDTGRDSGSSTSMSSETCTKPAPESDRGTRGRPLDPDTVDLAHREDPRPRLPQHPPLTSSSSRTPSSATFADRPPEAARLALEPAPASPSAAASGIPWTFPLGLVSGVLMSEWASIQSTPPGPCTEASPPSVPSATEWSPPRTSGIAPARVASATLSAISSHVRPGSRGEARALVAEAPSPRRRPLDVAVVADLVAEALRRSSSPA